MTLSKAKIAIAAIMGVVFVACQISAQDSAEQSVQATGNPVPVASNAGYGVDYVPATSNLFQNYYTDPTHGPTAAMYMAPRPVPANVGWTYYTYQPLYPHELMYQHHRTYYNFYNPQGGFYADPCRGQYNAIGNQGINKTTVTWQAGDNYYGPLPASLNSIHRLQYWRQSHQLRGMNFCY